MNSTKTKRLISLTQTVKRLPTPSRQVLGTGRFNFPLPGRVLLGCRTQRFESTDCHPHFTMIVNLATPGRVCVDETPIELRPGHALLVFPFQQHKIDAFSHDAITWLFVTFETENIDPLMPIKNTPLPIPEGALQFLKWVCNEALARPGRQPDVNRQVLFLSFVLLDLVNAAKAQGLPVAAARMTNPTHNELLRKLGCYLSWHMGCSPMRIDEVARGIGVSASHLRALFKQHVRISLGQFIRRNKVRHAVYLLDNTDLNLTQVSDKCGLGSLYSFSRSFKREMAISPSEYRRKKRIRSASVLALKSTP